MEEVAVKRLGLESGIAERGLHLRVPLNNQRFMAAVPSHEASTGFGDELLEFREAVAAADDEWAAGFFELRGEIFQQDGTLVASVAQEGLIRLRDD